MAPFSPLRAALFVSASVLLLAGCGAARSVDPDKTAAPMPPITEMDAAMAAPAPQPLTLTASDTITPAMPVASVDPADVRIAKLEETVNSLRADYDRIMPAFASLNTTNQRIQTLLDEMEGGAKAPVAHNNVPAMSAPVPAPVAMKAAAPLVVPPPVAAMKTQAVAVASPVPAPNAEPKAPVAPATISSSVTGVRIGEHAGKTRLVFDLKTGAKPAFTYDLDNTEQLLLIDLPGASWDAKAAAGRPASPMIAGWTATKTAAGGTSVAIELKKTARVLSTEYLKAEGKDPARLVVDVASGG